MEPLPSFKSSWPHPDLPVVMSTAAEVDAFLRESLTSLLEPAGFENVHRGRRWVRARPPLRDVFEIMTMKGASLALRWGLSLDFVPQVKGEAVLAHRTNKSAQLDIVFDPNDTASEGIHLHTCHGSAGLRRDGEAHLPRAVRSALDWFASADERGLVAFIDMHRANLESSRRFKFHNYPQQQLALAFALMREGRAEDAAAELEAAARERYSTKTFARLVALLEEQRPRALPARTNCSLRS